MGEPKPIRQRSLQLEYRSDRLLPDKLAHVYLLLVPDRRQPIGGETPKQANPSTGVNDEQASSHLCARVLGPSENHAIASQTAALIEYAQKNGYSVPPDWVFQDEGYSGAPAESRRWWS